MKNLWQNLETLTSDMTNPITLVGAQSDYLREGTGGLFYIDISEFTKPASATKTVITDVGIANDFMYRMSLSSEYLEDYTFNIFNIYYGITFYPLLVNVPSEIGQEIIGKCDIKNVDSPSKTRMYFLTSSESEFEQLLEAVFNCEKVRTILKNMKAIIGDDAQEE